MGLILPEAWGICLQVFPFSGPRDRASIDKGWIAPPGLAWQLFCKGSLRTRAPGKGIPGETAK